MKLIDFLSFDPLNVLRRQMNADLISYSAQMKWTSLTEREIEALSKQGIDIPWEDVRVLDDGTLAYKDSRVVVYIRDVEFYRGKYHDISMPRYHFADCRTLHEMREKKRYNRYVVATREDGVFKVNLRSKLSKEFRSEDRSLNVCQNCLSRIRWDDFSYAMSQAERLGIVSQFTLKKFFERFRKSLVTVEPIHTDQTAPLNEYPSDFSEISLRLKHQRRFYCDDCGLHFEDRPGFLHAHHIDGQKSNSVQENLTVVCLGCHAEQPGHAHMKAHPEYGRFMEELGNVWRRARTDRVPFG